MPILHISGLDNYALPRPRFKATPLADGQPAAPQAGSGTGGTYMGYDFRAAYAPGASLVGTGQIVGLLEFDGYNASDISYYEMKAGLPSVTLSNVLLNGVSGRPSGAAFPVAHFHQAREMVQGSAASLGEIGLSVSRQFLAFSVTETTGEAWLQILSPDGGR